LNLVFGENYINKSSFANSVPFLQNVTKIITIECAPYSGVGEPGSSVNIVSGYALDDWAIEVRSPAEARGLFL
jgi:hypothetical protein